MGDAVQEAVERLKKFDEYMGRNEDFHTLLASHEAQREEIEWLRGALREFVYETTHLSPEREDGSHDCRISSSCLSAGRAALTD